MVGSKPAPNKVDGLNDYVALCLKHWIKEWRVLQCGDAF